MLLELFEGGGCVIETGTPAIIGDVLELPKLPLPPALGLGADWPAEPLDAPPLPVAALVRLEPPLSAEQADMERIPAITHE